MKTKMTGKTVEPCVRCEREITHIDGKPVRHKDGRKQLPIGHPEEWCGGEPVDIHDVMLEVLDATRTEQEITRRHTNLTITYVQQTTELTRLWIDASERTTKWVKMATAMLEAETARRTKVTQGSGQ